MQSWYISIGNQIISSAIWNNYYDYQNLWSLKKFTSAYLFQIVLEKSCEFMKIYEIAYHNYAEAKRADQVQK